MSDNQTEGKPETPNPGEATAYKEGPTPEGGNGGEEVQNETGVVNGQAQGDSDIPTSDESSKVSSSADGRLEKATGDEATDSGDEHQDDDSNEGSETTPTIPGPDSGETQESDGDIKGSEDPESEVLSQGNGSEADSGTGSEETSSPDEHEPEPTTNSEQPESAETIEKQTLEQAEEQAEEDKRKAWERLIDKLLGLRERVFGDKAPTDIPEDVLKDMEQLKEHAESLVEENANYLERLVTLSAEFENYKKRVANNLEMEKERAQQQAIAGLFPILDSLEMSLRFAPDYEKAAQLLKNMLAGLHGINKQMTDFLVSIGLTPIESVGQDFDPELHDAVEVTEEGSSYLVMEEVQKGFLLKGRVVRPAKVKVEPKRQEGEETALEPVEQKSDSEDQNQSSNGTSNGYDGGSQDDDAEKTPAPHDQEKPPPGHEQQISDPTSEPGTDQPNGETPTDEETPTNEPPDTMAGTGDNPAAKNTVDEEEDTKLGQEEAAEVDQKTPADSLEEESDDQQSAPEVPPEPNQT